MAKIKKIDKIASASKIEYIRENVTKHVSKDRIEAAVLSIKKDETISSLLDLFSSMNNNFAEESEALQEEAPGYNKKYATALTGKFTVGYNSLKEIKEQIKFLYRIMNAMSNKPSKQDTRLVVDSSSIEFDVRHTLIGTMSYSGTLFDMLTERQKRLVREILQFLIFLDKNLELCQSIIEEEERIGNDADETYIRFVNQLNEVYEYVKGNNTKVRNTDADYYVDLISAHNNPAITRKWWHKLKPEQFVDIVYGTRDKLLSEFPALARKVYKEDINKLHKLKIVVLHVDEIGKLTGDVMVYIYKYTGCQASFSSFLKSFKEFYQILGGKQKVVSNVRFGQAYAAFPSYGTPQYVNFETTMDSYCRN